MSSASADQVGIVGNFLLIWRISFTASKNIINVTSVVTCRACYLKLGIEWVWRSPGSIPGGRRGIGVGVQLWSTSLDAAVRSLVVGERRITAAQLLPPAAAVTRYALRAVKPPSTGITAPVT